MKETIKTTREQMINDLLNSTLDHIRVNPDFLELIFLEGFTGFNSYTNDDLVEVYREYINEEYPENVEIILEKEGA